jgi:small subunit ribosomal protein S17
MVAKPAKQAAAKEAAKPAKLPEAAAPAAAAPAAAAPAAAAPAAAAPAAAAPAPTIAVGEPHPGSKPASKAHSFRRKLVGKVTSNKMDKTVTVEVIRNSPDPVYKKYVRQRERYKAHDETNRYKVGDRVEIQEHRPISHDKRWLVTRLISRPVEE